MSEAETTNHADESIRAESGSQLTNIRLVGFDRPFLAAVAVALSLFTLVGGGVAVTFMHNTAMEAARDAKDSALQAQRDARLAQYYNIDLEVYIAKQGLSPPKDPWRKQKKEANK